MSSEIGGDVMIGNIKNYIYGCIAGNATNARRKKQSSHDFSTAR